MPGDSKALADGGFGLQYTLDYQDSPAEPTYVVPKDTLLSLCQANGLEPLVHEHGTFNFHDVATYIEKSTSKGHLWRQLPTEHRELVGFWSTYVFQKLQ